MTAPGGEFWPSMGNWRCDPLWEVCPREVTALKGEVVPSPRKLCPPSGSDGLPREVTALPRKVTSQWEAWSPTDSPVREGNFPRRNTVSGQLHQKGPNLKVLRKAKMSFLVQSYFIWLLMLYDIRCQNNLTNCLNSLKGPCTHPPLLWDVDSLIPTNQVSCVQL